ncbi:DUF3110 domain-containing protein [Spirulina sp. 06S082]|uniref:DUF3110 domain-containing protein n=1 Tax=Spirulina sp. 06S082 TaxID=3110248 RepID=UPI002B1FE369|nr:DUF3110 domain-containing protein [Spirulina sp. 06S082]MEA5468512.1 DUF3110 domain-containing protein [Spirulina sp. 06S082]
MLAPQRIYVLLINAGTDREGIHSLQIGDRQTVLMFESEDDAIRYALMLEAQDFPAPSIEPFPAEEIEGFCREAGYNWEIVKEGQLEIPPEMIVDETTWTLEDSPPPSSSQQETEEREMSDEELDAQRRALEKLFGN